VTRVQSNEVTVKNQGTAAAGPFYVRVYNGAAVRDTVLVSALAAGASAAVAYNSGGCDGSWTTVADYTNVVPESNETNNTWNGVEPFVC
jgi:subtilase family serine protease